MPFGPDRSDWYLHGIRRAEQDGLIDYPCENGDRPVLSDEYGHIGHVGGAPLLLKYTNTRPLSFVARQLLGLYRDEPDARLLELGPGAGVACAAMYRLLPAAKIDTVSLTPLNPYMVFRWDDMYDHIRQPFSHEKCLSSLYDTCSSPFVHNQYIGEFPERISPPKEKYHFIYENYGAIYYNFHRSGNDAPVELARTSIAAVLSLLREDGTILIMASDGAYRVEELLESAAIDRDVIVACKRMEGWHCFPCIVARKESPFSVRLRAHENGLLSKSERVLRLEYQTFEQVISKICASCRVG
jgi:hypothetical protein